MKPFLAVAASTAMWVFAQTGGGAQPDLLSQLASIGVGALIAAPFVWLWRDERKQRIGAESRERERSERELKALIAATDTLERVEQGMAAQVQRVAPERNEWDLVLRRLELIGDELRGARRDQQ